MGKTRKLVPLADYAEEVMEDLPKLIASYPTGVRITHLQAYYGETSSRTVKVMYMLAEQGRVHLGRTTSRAQYITPIGYEPPTKFPELTELQRKLLVYILDKCNSHIPPASMIKTNYHQLSRIMNSSYGGMRACLKRLIELGYLHMTEQPKSGRQDGMVISIGAKALKETS